MTVPTISNLPTVPATSDPNFETEAPALFNHIKNTFVSEMNSAISFINSSTFDATVEFKDGNFTAARNFLYMIDTSSGGVSVTLPANPSTGDQLLLMDQKRSFGSNNLTIGRNSQNINGAASDVVSKSTGALIRCIFQASYGWTVDLYEGEWESGTSAGDLVYTGGNVGIGTSSPDSTLHVVGTNSGDDLVALNLTNKNTADGTATAIRFTNSTTENFLGGEIAVERQSDDSNDLRINLKNADVTATYPRMLTIDGSTGKVGIGTSSPNKKLHVTDSNEIVATLTNSTNDDATKTLLRFSQHTDLDSVSGTVGINRLGANAGCGFEINLADSNGAEQNRLTILENGKVGIGTTDPEALLTLRLNTGIGFLIEDPTAERLHMLTRDGSGHGYYIGYADGETVGYKLNSSGDSYFIGGDVGIGTNSPDVPLHIYKNHTSGNGEWLNIGFDDVNPKKIEMGSTSYSAYMSLYSASAVENVKLDSSGDSYFLGGNVGIGTNSPDAKLDIDIGASNADGLLVTSANNALVTGDHIKAVSQRGSTDAYNLLNLENATGTQMIVKGNGLVGINTDSPSALFDIHVPTNATVGTLYTTEKEYDDPTNRVDLFFKYKFNSSGTQTGGSMISLVKESTADGHYGSDIRLWTRQDGVARSEKMRITGAGDVEVKTGNLVIGTAGKGIDFSANSHATGMSSELFDDYEEGSFTPYLYGSTAAGVFTYTNQVGRYTKIGNLVQFQITLSASGTTTAPTGTISIQGLPFTSKSTNQVFAAASVGWTQNITGGGDLGAYVVYNNTFIALRHLTDASGNFLSASSVGNSFFIIVTGTYQT